MPMRRYHHLLFATDLSEADQAAALRAAELARSFRARLTLLHVVPDFPENVPINPAPENVDPTAFIAAHARRSLARLASLIGRTRAAQKVVFSTGSARHVIVSVARDVDADLIVLAASGHHLMGGLNTTAGVLNDAGCDVMVLRKAPPPAAAHAALVSRRRKRANRGLRQVAR